MIASKLAPSLLLKSVGTSIHCQNFKCFISTAKRGLFSKKVSTIIFDGDPGVTAFKPLVEMVYAGHMSTATRLMLHDVIVEKVNEAGESGFALRVIVRDLYLDMRQRKLIISSPAFEWEIWNELSDDDVAGIIGSKLIP
jgi:hypothetical protein